MAAGPALSADQTVSIAGFAFTPAAVTVNVGESVTWRWDGPDTNHSVTSDPGQAESFDSDPGVATGSINHPTGFTFRYTFTRAGVFTYLCRVHSTMKGSVRVVAEPPPPDPSDTTAPAVSGLRADPREFCKRHRRCRRPGTLIRFNLSEAATINAQTIGRVAGRRVVNSHVLGRGVVGANAKRFRAERLAPGRYLMKLTATDASGNSSTKQVRIRVAPPLAVEVTTPTRVEIADLTEDGLRSVVRCNGTCDLRAQLRLGKRLLGEAEGSFTRNRRSSLRLRLSDAGRELLADRRTPAALVLTVKGTGPSGGTSVPARRFLTAIP